MTQALFVLLPPVGQWVFDKSRDIRVQKISVWGLLSLAALHAEGGGDGGEDGYDEVDYGFPGFSFHDVSFFWA